MAKNLINGRWANEEVLHTEASWISHRSFNLGLDTSFDEASAISACEARERAVYKEFGCASHSAFVRRIRNNFLDNPQDAEVLSQFEQENFSRHLRNLAIAARKEPYKTQPDEVIIKIDATKANKELQKTLRKMPLLNDNGDNFEIKIGLRSSEMAKILNLYKKQTSKNHKSGSYKSGTLSQKKMEDILKLNGSDAIQISTSSGTDIQEYYETTFLEEDIMSRTSKSFPWGFKQHDIELALKQDKNGKIRQQLEEAYNVLKHFFTEVLPAKGSSKMKRAAHAVWQQKLGDRVDKSIGFFEKGDVTYLKVGAGGEFAGAILLQYLAYTFGTFQKANEVVKISGDDASNLGVQGKADLMLLDKYGIQVKNFDLAHRKGTLIDTNTSFYRIAEQNGVNAQDIKIFFANYFFNEDFANDHSEEYDLFCKNLQNYMYLVYSLAVNDYIEKETVNFYLIGGRYLVPSSEILRSLGRRRTMEKIPIEIKPTIKAKSSDELRNKHKDYWSMDENGLWEASESNEKHFANIIGNPVNRRTVSIRSNIDYSLFLNRLEKGEYGLW